MRIIRPLAICMSAIATCAVAACGGTTGSPVAAQVEQPATITQVQADAVGCDGAEAPGLSLTVEGSGNANLNVELRTFPGGSQYNRNDIGKSYQFQGPSQYIGTFSVLFNDQVVGETYIYISDIDGPLYEATAPTEWPCR